MNTGTLTWYIMTTGLMAVMLYFPVKKFILAGRIVQTEKRLNRGVTGQERKEIGKKAGPAALLISIFFSIFFNLFLMGRFFKKL